MSTNTSRKQQEDPHGVPQFQLHHRLGLLMEAANVPAEDMATALGVHKNSVYNYLSGYRTPKRGAIRTWALRCGRADLWYWLETGEEPADPTESDGSTPTTIWYRKRHLSLCVAE